MTPDTAHHHDWQSRAIDPDRDRESELLEAVKSSRVGVRITWLLNVADEEKDKLNGRVRRGIDTPEDRAVLRLIETVENALGVADDPWCLADAIKGEMEG
jgi:hypothetical protein